MKSLQKLCEELEELENREFMLQMVDHWSPEDSRYYNELREKIRNVENQIKELTNGGM